MESYQIDLLRWNSFALMGLSFCISAIAIYLAPKIPRLSGGIDHTSAVQSMHVRRTARVGGIAIFGPIVISTFLVPFEISATYNSLVLAAAVVFLAGILEDLGFAVSPRNRLIATASASLLAIWSLGVWLPRLHVPGVDLLIGHWSFGIPITLLVTTGVANGFNMVDGVNGLSSLITITSAVTLSSIAQQAGYTDIVPLAIMLAAIVLGFFVLNFPYGLIFLGDGGAYVLGFILAWFGVLILVNAPAVSPWAIILTLFWPIADMLLSIYRRTTNNKASTSADRMHVHQMVLRTLEIYFVGRGRRKLTNPLTTLILAPFVIAPAIMGVYSWDKPILAPIAVLIFTVSFFTLYISVSPIVKKHKRRRLNNMK